MTRKRHTSGFHRSCALVAAAAFALMGCISGVKGADAHSPGASASAPQTGSPAATASAKSTAFGTGLSGNGTFGTGLSGNGTFGSGNGTSGSGNGTSDMPGNTVVGAPGSGTAEKDGGAVRVPFGAMYQSASDAFEKAMRMKAGAERRAAFLVAAELYEHAFSVAPSVDAAPEAAINGAYAFKQAGQWERALDLYRRFLAEYPTSEKIAALKKTDPRRAEERVRFARQAAEALGAALVSNFDYRGAAVHYDSVARNPLLTESFRRDWARNATILFTNLGDAKSAASARDLFLKLSPDVRSKATIDRVVALGGFHDWTPSPADTDALRAARKARVKALEHFVATYERVPEAAEDVMDVAYRLHELHRRDSASAAAAWCKKAKKAYEIAAHASQRKIWTPDPSGPLTPTDCQLRPPSEAPPSTPRRPTAHLGRPLSPPPNGVAPPRPIGVR
ncbi:MAG: tetratricopeptide repeat protein [Polyangiaceae bacterium]